MPRSRSNLLITIGLAVFVVGTSLAYLLLRDGGDTREAEAASSTSPTVAAPQPAAPAPPAAAAAVTIPEGMQAVAVQVPFVQGVAGFVQAGDRVNVFAAFKDAKPNGVALDPPLAKLALSNVEVLAVHGPEAGAGSGNYTYLLALDAQQAEQVIYLSTFQALHLTKVPKDQPAASTPGRAAQNAV